jgi:ABC-2 type transport system ATP-binding protein
MADFLDAGSGGPVTVRSPQAAELAARLTAHGATVTRHDGDTLAVTGTTPEEIGELARAGGLTLTGLTAGQATLEDRYMELTRDSADYRAAPGEPAATRK